MAGIFLIMNDKHQVITKTFGQLIKKVSRVRVMVFNATFNNISEILRPAASH
jgi:hypothetical protein